MDQQIRFCTASDGARLAYATAGAGFPLVKVANWLSHLEYDLESPIWGHLFQALAAEHSLVRYDQRGTGLSDRDVASMSFADWVTDLETVVDAARLERFDLLGISQGGPVALAYALQHPERVRHLILYGTFAQIPKDSEEMNQAMLALILGGWGQGKTAFRQLFTSLFIPDATAEQMRWFNELERKSASPETAVRIMTEIWSIDVAEIAKRLNVPTLILHSRGDEAVAFSAGRELAALIPNARFVPLEGKNHYFLEHEPAREVFLHELAAFTESPLESAPHAHPPRDGAGGVQTILFTDLVGHTAMMQRLGDARGREVLREHERTTRETLKQFGGAEIKTDGDSFMVSFASVTAGVDCAIALQRAFAARNEGGGEPLQIRIGLNAGEPVEEDGDLFGSSVIIAARVAAMAAAGEILIPEPLRHLLAGKTYVYADRGETMLKGFEDAVRLYEVRWQP
jgi:class 3 adenylate cyclase/pimeloyl-ACP methyl ester carboxylesterase